jgi:hypothetical protein
VLCFFSPEAKVRLEAIEMRGVRRPPHRLDWEYEDVVREDESWDGRYVVELRVVELSLWVGFWEVYLILLLLFLLQALRMQTSAKLIGPRDPLISISAKAHRCWPWPAHIWQCADSLPAEMLRWVVGLRTTLKDAYELEFRQASLLRVVPRCFVWSKPRWCNRLSCNPIFCNLCCMTL